MRKVLLAITVFISVASAQMMPSQMPKDSSQYVLTQQILSAIHAYEEECGDPSDQLQKALRQVYEIYQTVCGGYFVSTTTPLREIDLALTEYKFKSAWQKVTGGSYRRIFNFKSAEMKIELLELALDEAIIIVTYQKPKTPSKN